MTLAATAMLAWGFVESLGVPLITLAVVVAWAFALVDLFRNPGLSGAQRAAWLLIIVLLPLVGTVLYFGLRSGA
jgi:hypothetical protein